MTENKNNPLGYADERDKAYGVASMTVTLVALDGEEHLGGIDIDASAGDEIYMVQTFGMKGNPRMSAKILWEQSVKELRLSASMALGNLVGRRYVLAHRGLTRDDTEALRRVVRTEASEHCSLDFDEADRLFDHCLSYVDRLFRHSGVQVVTHGFAKHVIDRRQLSAAEAFELLSSLGLR